MLSQRDQINREIKKIYEIELIERYKKKYEKMVEMI